MAGENADFNADLFREQIHAAMEMGKPNDPLDQVTWRWLKKRVYQQKDADPAGLSWTWAATPVSLTAIPDKIVPCAVEFIASPREVTDTPIGQFNTARGVITLLDVDYNALVNYAGGYGLTGKERLPDQALIGTNTYNLNFEAPPMGLFGVNVHQVYLSAEDES